MKDASLQYISVGRTHKLHSPELADSSCQTITWPGFTTACDDASTNEFFVILLIPNHRSSPYSLLYAFKVYLEQFTFSFRFILSRQTSLSIGTKVLLETELNCATLFKEQLSLWCNLSVQIKRLVSKLSYSDGIMRRICNQWTFIHIKKYFKNTRTIRKCQVLLFPKSATSPL